MFKSIPGNSQYTVSLAQEFRTLDGDLCDVVPDADGKVEIEIYGEKIRLDPTWVSLIAHFELYLPDADLRRLFNIRFVPNNVRFFRPVSSQLPVFLRPQTVKNNNKTYRVVPSHSRYAVCKDGEVIETDSFTVVKTSVWRNKKTADAKEQYPCVYIYDPDRSMYRYVYVHRLVGMAWLTHPDGHYVRLPILNHKDGNKLNSAAKNLEWCSFQSNTTHAVNEGLRGDNIPCRVRDFFTGKVYDFASKAQAATFMGISTTMLNKINAPIRKGKLYADRYEFKLQDDDTPWFYESRKVKLKPGRYLLTVTTEDGEQTVFSDLRDFKKQYGIWNVSNAEEILKLAKTRYPKLKFDLVDQYKSLPVQAYCLESKEIVETRTIRQMAQKVSVSYGKIHRCLRGHETWTYNGYAFRYKTEKNWDTSFVKKDVPRSKPLQATNLITQETLVFPSMTAAARALKMDDRYWGRHCDEQEMEHKGWRFKLLSE